MRQVDCVWPVDALLGEGPIWHHAERALWFTDIKGSRLHRYDPATGRRDSHDLPGGAGFVVPAQDGGLVVGMGQVLQRFERGALGEVIAEIDTAPGNRINDGTVDCHGRIWFGTMDDAETAPTGAVHMHVAGTTHRTGGECIITNGPAVSPDGAHLYHVDTCAGLIWRFAIADGHELQHGEVFARIPPAEGFPDGVTLDSDGCLWVSLWGGWSVRRYAPDGGLLETVKIPAAQVTKLAFGGDDLRTAYVTTARIGLGDAQLARQPLAGGLFRFRVDVPGNVLPVARLSA